MAKWLDKYEQGGMVLKQKTHDNYGKKPNPNDVQMSAGPGFVGEGYNIKGRDYSPAWGGQFQNGGVMNKASMFASLPTPTDIYNYGRRESEEIAKRAKLMWESKSLNPTLPMHSDTLYPGNKYKDAFMKTPNIRTEKDESFKKGHSLTNEQKAIVLHHTGYTDTTRDNDVSWAMRGVDAQFRKPGESSHVVIDFNGNRYNYANPNQVTFHAGKSSMNNKNDVNDFGVGVEFQGDTDQRPLTKEQIESFIEYAAPIIKKNKIPINNVITHKQIRKNYIDKNLNDKDVQSKPDVNDKEYSKIIQALKKKGVLQMGGSLPGAVGFTYARTQDPAPSNGPYAKKTLASAQNGKKVDPNEKKYQAPDKNKIVDWFNNYYTSPFFKENLYDKGNAFMENVGDKLGKATAEKINNLDYTFKDVDNLGYFKGTSYDLENTVNMGNPNNYHNQSKSVVLAHELGHVNQDAILGQQPRNLAIMLNRNNQVNRKRSANDIYNIANEMPPKNDFGELLYPHLPSVGSYRADRLKNWSRDENLGSLGDFHDNLLGELRGDIMGLRYLASKEGIWDAAKNKPGSFTPEMLDKLYKSKTLNTPQVTKDSKGNITLTGPNPKSLKPSDLKNVAPPKKPGGFLNRLRERYNDSDLLYLMNKLAKNEENAPMDKAQNGKEMSFYQNGLDFKPKTISKNGSVIKDDMGQWSHPGEVTEISGDTMATHGYGNVPLYVVPDKGSPRIIQANTGTQKFPGATKFTEYPMAQDGGWLDKYK